MSEGGNITLETASQMIDEMNIKVLKLGIEYAHRSMQRMVEEQNILQRQVEVLISKLVDEGDCDVCPCEIEVCHHDPEACRTMIRQWSRSEAEQHSKTGRENERPG
jgi:hypothetical protein